MVGGSPSILARRKAGVNAENMAEPVRVGVAGVKGDALDLPIGRRKQGLPKCSFHGLRKSYCTNLAGAVPLHVVQELAGHADIRTTRRHSVKVRDEQIDSARRALEEVMRS